MTISPVCPQEHFSLYKFKTFGSSFAQKDWATLLHFIIIYFICFYLLIAYTRKPIKSYLSILTVIPLSRSLVNTLCSSLGSTLSLIEKVMLDPLHFWVITSLAFLSYFGRETSLVNIMGPSPYFHHCLHLNSLPLYFL